MSDETQEKPRSNKGLIISGVIASIIAIITIISLIEPVLIIGYIWDWDIQNQLETLDRDTEENTSIKFRLMYENNEESEMRAHRAIDVFLNSVYDPEDPEDNYTIMKTDDKIILEFNWKSKGS